MVKLVTLLRLIYDFKVASFMRITRNLQITFHGLLATRP